MVEKVVNAEVKKSLQPPSRTKEINFRYPKDYRPAKKDKTNWDQQDKDKNKSTQNPIPTNAN